MVRIYIFIKTRCYLKNLWTKTRLVCTYSSGCTKGGIGAFPPWKLCPHLKKEGKKDQNQLFSANFWILPPRCLPTKKILVPPLLIWMQFSYWIWLRLWNFEFLISWKNRKFVLLSFALDIRVEVDKCIINFTMMVCNIFYEGHWKRCSLSLSEGG